MNDLAVLAHFELRENDPASCENITLLVSPLSLAIRLGMKDVALSVVTEYCRRPQTPATVYALVSCATGSRDTALSAVSRQIAEEILETSMPARLDQSLLQNAIERHRELCGSSGP